MSMKPNELIYSIEENVRPLAPALDSESLSELIVNPDGHVWIAAGTDGYTSAGLLFPAGRLQNFGRYVATWAERSLTPEEPSISIGPLPLRGHAYRVTVVGPPLARGMALCLRRLAENPPRLEDYVAEGRITERQAGTLVHLLEQGKAVLVIGAQRSGKTTFASALLNATLRRHTGLRATLIEDTPEIHVEDGVNLLALQTTPAHDLESLVALALRTGSDLLSVGEIRDRSVRHLLNAFLSGHGGLATFHATTAEEALHRIALLAGYPSMQQISAAVPFVVTLENAHVREIVLTSGTSEELELVL